MNEISQLKLSDPIPQEMINEVITLYPPVRFFDNLFTAYAMALHRDPLLSCFYVSTVCDAQLSFVFQKFTGSNLSAQNGLLFESSLSEIDVLSFQTGITVISWFAEKGCFLLSSSNHPGTVIRTAAILIGSSPLSQKLFYKTASGQAFQHATHTLYDQGSKLAKKQIVRGVDFFLSETLLNPHAIKWIQENYERIKARENEDYEKRNQAYEKQLEAYNAYTAYENQVTIYFEQLHSYYAKLFDTPAGNSNQEATNHYDDDTHYTSWKKDGVVPQPRPPKERSSEEIQRLYNQAQSAWENLVKAPTPPDVISPPIRPEKSFMHFAINTCDDYLQSWTNINESLAIYENMPFVGFITRNLRRKMIPVPIQNLQPKEISTFVAHKVADVVVAKTWTVVKFSMFFNHCFLKSEDNASHLSKRQQLISAVMIVANGGPKQTVQEFALRTIAATAVFYTGSKMAKPLLFTFIGAQIAYNYYVDDFEKTKEEKINMLKTQQLNNDQIKQALVTSGYDERPELKIANSWKNSCQEVISQTYRAVLNFFTSSQFFDIDCEVPPFFN